MNFSVTIAGILLAVGVPMLVKLGFSESCSNEVVNYIIPLLGGALAWFGRVRVGDIKVSGFKK
jgi:hypothetical protein